MTYPNINRLNKRRGSVLILLAALLPALGALSAFAINAAYMQLSRTQLMVATDAATRAGGRAMSEYQDPDQAVQASQITAALNQVAGSPLRIDTTDFIFGEAEPVGRNSSRFDFEPVSRGGFVSGASVNALKVVGRRDSGSSGGAIDLIFKGFGSVENFGASFQSISTQVDRDIVLVLDRSGSMAWVPYEWPPGKDPFNYPALNQGVKAGVLSKWRGRYRYAPGYDSNSYQSWYWESLKIGSPPPSPWEDLLASVEAFLEVLEETPQSEHVAIVTYATNATVDVKLTPNYKQLLNKLKTLKPYGGTAIGTGLTAGNKMFEPSSSSKNEKVGGRPFAAKTVVVMTDGMHNYGESPLSAAKNIRKKSPTTIHAITFTDGANQKDMQKVAEEGGGRHYHADSGLDLVDTFREVANNLPTILTQ